MNVVWRLSGVRCQILTIDGLSFLSIALAAQGIADIAVSRLAGPLWARAASSVALMVSAVLASMVLGLWYFSELPLQQTASESVVPALALTSKVVATLSLGAALLLEIALTRVRPRPI